MISLAEYTFQFLQQFSDDEYLSCIDGEELVRLWQEGIITYNPEIQRGSRTKVLRNNEESEEPVYSKGNVKKIYEAMVADNYFVDMITLNVLADENGSITIDNERMEMHVIGEINIADGQHRIRALEMLNESNNKGYTNLDLSVFRFPLKITNLPVPLAKQQFHQFATNLKISSSRSEYFNFAGIFNTVVRNLMRNSELSGRIEIIKNTITKNETRNIVTFATLVNAVEMVYKNDIETNAQAASLSEYLSEFFNVLINAVPEFSNFERRQQSKETSLIAENFMFYGYVAISKLIRDKENWQQYVPMVNQLDLAKESEVWFGKVTKRGRNGLSIINSSDSRKYFIEKITEKFEELLQNQ